MINKNCALLVKKLKKVFGIYSVGLGWKCVCTMYFFFFFFFFFFLFALLNPIITILNTAYTAYIIYNIHTILTILTILIAYIANNTTVFKHYYISYASSTQLHRKKLI